MTRSYSSIQISFFMESEKTPAPTTRANLPLSDDSLCKALQAGLYHVGGRAMLFTLPFFLPPPREAAAWWWRFNSKARKLRTLMKVSNSIWRRGGNIHTSSTQYTSTLCKKLVTTVAPVKGKTKQNTLLSCKKWFSGETFCFDCPKQTGQIFIAWC